MKHCCFYTAPCGKKECLHVIILFVFAGIEVCKGSYCKRRSFRLYQDQIPLVAWSESKANPEQKQQIEENWRQTALGSHPFSCKSQGKAGAVDLALLISNSPQMWEISNPAWFQVCHQGKVTQRQHSSPAEQRQHWSFFPSKSKPTQF